MKKTRILFVLQEITPYLPESQMSLVGRHLPQGIQEKGREIRTFMPRYGCINERRHQLHEVIRLSGMNMIIDDTDHPLIIKVASIQAARMQVYFIDNEEYFQRKAVLNDADGNPFKDNDERAIFFCRGVVETVKKLGWAPDIIHCHGWLTSLLPLYLKKSYKDDPLFSESKIVYSVYNDSFDGPMNKKLSARALFEGVDADDLKSLKTPDYLSINKLSIDHADAIIQGSETIHPELKKHISSLDKPVLDYQSPENFVEAYSDFYDEIMEENPILAD